MNLLFSLVLSFNVALNAASVPCVEYTALDMAISLIPYAAKEWVVASVAHHVVSPV